ncbi:Mannosyltransferase (PIG-V) [Sinosporangium album]|uniref:Mannosyltransferase (PIG-V) n=1 Tax=Sinosporangium album TaxID=504805 RepID=A0A1G8ES43_9ACTN|nr:mannosyltransferase family protein [Sinosporangium album]SDH72674.1 Mannosyltransferase (PIG-V) [Sinosporangium album]
MNNRDLPALIIWIASRLGILLTVTLGVALLAAGGASPPLLEGLHHWDVRKLEWIAAHGYGSDPASPAFFPGQPLALRVVGFAVPNLTVAGVVLSFVAGAVAVVALSRLADREGGEGTGPVAVLALVLAPTAVFLFVGYSEALFLAFAIPAWLAARQRRWMWAGLLGAGASCVRITGLFLALALIVEFFTARPRRAGAEARTWRGAAAPRLSRRAGRSAGGTRLLESPVTRRAGTGGRMGGAAGSAGSHRSPGSSGERDAGWLAVPFLPLVAYSVYQFVRTGDWLAWHHAQEAGWGRHLVWPWESFLTTVRSAFLMDNKFTWAFRMELVAAAVGLAFVLWLLYRRRWSEFVYTGSQLGALLVSSYYLSIPRTLLLWWPMWIALACACRRHSWLLWVYGLVAGPLMVVNALAFLHGVWAG